MIFPTTAVPLSGMTSTQPTQQPDSTAPLTPTPAQLAFMRSMSGPTTVNYTLDFLKKAASTFTSKKVDEQALSKLSAITGEPAPVSYPDARRMLATWFSLLGPDGQAAAAKSLAALAPGIDPSKLASRIVSPTGESTLSPSPEAMAEAAKIPTSSVKDAIMGLLDTMDPSLYPKAGEVAMNAQLTQNIITGGMPLLSYLTQQAKEALQEGS